MPPESQAMEHESLVGRLADEFTRRRRQGELPRIEEYVQRHPEIAALLQDVLSAVEAMSPVEPGAVTTPYDTGRLAETQPYGRVAAAVARPRTAAGYEIQGELGRGGMGVVYKARHAALNRIVALKMLRDADDSSDPDLVRFRNEAQAVARLQHPNIVQIFEVGEADGRPYLSLEFVEGGNLAAKIKGEPQPVRDAARLIETLARAVSVAHAHGLIHRDLKPANILLAADGTPKISDFGLVKRLDDESARTQSGAIVGTPSYMAPEQASGETTGQGPAVDIYALGAMLYELIAGRPPHKGASVLETLDLVKHVEPVAPSQLQPGCPRDLETICLTCLQKEPAKRYAAAADVAEDLRRFLADEPILARPVGSLERTWRWCRRNPWLAGSTAAAVAALIAGTVASTIFGVRASASATLANNRTVEAKTATGVAERERNQTRDALDAMTSQVASDLLAGQEKLTPQQKQFLEDAVAYYRRFAAEAADDKPGRIRAMSAQFRLGGLLARLGENADAATAYRQAQRQAESLTVQFPAELEHKKTLGRAELALASLEEVAGRLASAETAVQRAIAIFEKTVAEQPADRQAQFYLAQGCNNLGSLQRLLRRAADAEATHRRAMAIREGLLAAEPANVEYRNDLGLSCNNLGVVLLDLGRIEEAVEPFRRSVELKQGLAREFPESVPHRESLAIGQGNLAAIYKHLGRIDDATTALREAAAIGQQLADELPGVPRHQLDLAWTYHGLAAVLNEIERWSEAETACRQAAAINARLLAAYPDVALHVLQAANIDSQLGNILRDGGDRKAALTAYDSAIARIEGLLQTEPNNGPAIAELQNVHWGRATTMSLEGRHDEALVDWDRAIELDTGPNRASLRLAKATTLVKMGRAAEALRDADELLADPEVDVFTLYNATCVYSLASATVKDDPALVETYAAQAVELLGRSVAGGFQDSHHIDTDPELDPLWDRGDFKKLRATLDQPDHANAAS